MAHPALLKATHFLRSRAAPRLLRAPGLWRQRFWSQYVAVVHARRSGSRI